LWDLVNYQDRAVCESVQRGTASSFHTHGWFGPREERSLDVRRWVLSRLEAQHDDGTP
jgi:Rieske 2Fe-2S family protein